MMYQLPTWVHKMCPECLVRMPCTKADLSYPESYEYICPKCGREELSTTLFPYVEWEESKNA